MGLWKLTDDATFQHVREVKDSFTAVFELIDICAVSSDMSVCVVSHDIVNALTLLNGTKKQKAELCCVLEAFGYKNTKELRKIYGAHMYQIIAECLFEYYGPSLSDVSFTGTFDQCQQFIACFVADTSTC